MAIFSRSVVKRQSDVKDAKKYYLTKASRWRQQKYKIIIIINKTC